MKLYKAVKITLILLQTAMALVLTAALAGWGALAVAGRFIGSMQIVPALMGASVAWIAVWFALTALFGRVYCSTVCPLGALQDAVSALAMRTRRPDRRYYRYSPPRAAVRGATLAFLVACALCGLAVVWTLFEPYSAFSRIVVYLVDPALPGGRAAAISAGGIIVAAATLVAVTAVAWRGGRTLCNTVCPVGTVLGLLSGRSVYHFDINTDLCTQCRKCADVCHASCINLDDHTVDASRCLSCFRCAAECPSGAITFRRGRHRLAIPMMQPVAPEPAAADSMTRRRFIAASALGAAGTVAMRASAMSGGPLNHVTPPGTVGRDDFLSRCTACGACVARCPARVLVPSLRHYGISHALKPVMDFDASFCRYDCTACTRVCPTGALRPLSTTDKHSRVMGKARIDLGRCVAFGEGDVCGRCARVCPRQAIRMTLIDGRRAPLLNHEACIGCGACRYVCQASPVKAIVIEGT